MNNTKNSIQIPAEESGQGEVPYHLMSYNIPCILRGSDISNYRVCTLLMMDADGIDWGLERKFDWEPHYGKWRGILHILVKPLMLPHRKAPASESIYELRKENSLKSAAYCRTREGGWLVNWVGEETSKIKT